MENLVKGPSRPRCQQYGMEQFANPHQCSFPLQTSAQSPLAVPCTPPGGTPEQPALNIMTGIAQLRLDLLL
jgi:hypothetical protein